MKRTFEEVERFARTHTGCGTLTPRTSSPVGDRYLLTLACSCGKTLERWIPLEDATDRDAGTSIPMVDPEPPPTPTIDITAEVASRESFDDVMAAAIEALDSGTPKPAPSPPPSTPAVPSEPPAPPPAAPDIRRPSSPSPPSMPGPAGTRQPPSDKQIPDKQTLQDALRATMEALETERAQERAKPSRSAVRPPVPPAAPLPTSQPARPAPTPRRRRGPSMLAAVIAVSLLGIVIVWYGLRAPAESDRTPTVVNPVPARPKLADAERPAITQALGTLRELQSISTVDVPYRVYFNRFSFARAEAERHLAEVRDPDARAAVVDAVALHALAANAWRAKTLNERDKWETVGQDPAGDLCVATRRVLGIADEPPNMSRAQWRGMALAASIPLLWDCAGERLADLDRMLRDR